MNYIRTDLAIEANAQHQRGKGIAGVSVKEKKAAQDITITTVKVTTKQGEKTIGKPMGNYVTIEVKNPSQQSAQDKQNLIALLAGELSNMISDYAKDGILVVGLGNRSITPDSLGPAVCDSVFISRHIKTFAPDLLDDKISEVSAIAPGVLGITGLETFDVVKGVVDKIKPGVVIAIDSLASRSLSRISATYQLTDTGISPGSGIGNKRKALDKQQLGVPVVAVGVPLVVYASTIASDLIAQAIKSDNKSDTEVSDIIASSINKIMNADDGHMMVTPKEIDVIVKDCAKTISGAINLCVTKGVDLSEIDQLI
jgi:spore protease